MSSTIERATLTAPDISCGHCVATINKAVGAIDGVRTVSADERTKQVRVEFEPGKVSLAKIEAVLDEEGYPVQK
jgi:copper chaperone